MPSRCHLVELAGASALRTWFKKVRAAAVLTLLLAGSDLVVARSAQHLVSFQIRNGLLCIPCTTNRGNYDCVLDTGAAATVIDEHAVSGIAWLGTDQAGGIDGPHKMRLLETSVTVGGVSLKLVAHVTSLRPTIRADVIIGEDMLSQFHSVTIDYRTKTAAFDYGE